MLLKLTPWLFRLLIILPSCLCLYLSSAKLGYPELTIVQNANEMKTDPGTTPPRSISDNQDYERLADRAFESTEKFYTRGTDFDSHKATGNVLPKCSGFLCSFRRIDESWNEKEADVFEAESKLRILENDETVPSQVEDNSVESDTSKEYRQGLHEDNPSHLMKRDKDCVPVTWYNVFHHSIFGNKKFCHE